MLHGGGRGNGGDGGGSGSGCGCGGGSMITFPFWHCIPMAGYPHYHHHYWEVNKGIILSRSQCLLTRKHC